MQDSGGLRDVNKVSKVLTIGGLVAAVGGVVRLLTAPKELPMGAEGWFESADAHGSAWFLGVALIMFGLFFTVAGLGLSARGRRAGLALQKQNMQAMSEGVAAGLGIQGNAPDPKARLERLEELRRDGTLTEDEYRRKRSEIVAQL